MSNLAQHLTLQSMKDKVTPAEWKARVDLAACYRLVAHYDMSDMMANHISAAVPGEQGAFLINAYGMLYEEITASSLVVVGLDGTLLDPTRVSDVRISGPNAEVIQLQYPYAPIWLQTPMPAQVCVWITQDTSWRARWMAPWIT